VLGAAWSVPVLVVALPAAAAAASLPLPLVTSNPAAAGSGVDLYIRDGKYLGGVAGPLAPVAPSYTTSNRLVQMYVTVTVGGVPVVGASVSVVADGRADVQGDALVGFVPPTQTANVTQDLVPLSAYAAPPTDATGRATFAIATTSLQAAGNAPITGIWTVVVGATSVSAGTSASFTYTLVNG